MWSSGTGDGTADLLSALRTTDSQARRVTASYLAQTTRCSYGARSLGLPAELRGETIAELACQLLGAIQ